MWPFYLSAIGAGAAGILLALIVRGKPVERDGKNLAWLMAVLPFLSGGFYSFLAFPASTVLLVILFRLGKRNHQIKLSIGLGSAAVCLLWLSYGLACLWAEDRGMAVLGLTKFTPVLFLMLVLMQMPGEQRMEAYSLLPLSGGFMTVLSLPLALIPAAKEAIAPDGRLAGFMEYPNTYALFLLVCLVIHIRNDKQTARDWALEAVLMLGILASGSRTSFILMLFVIVADCVLKREKTAIIRNAAITAAVLGASALLEQVALLEEADRYLTTSAGDSTLLVRLLYYKDALKIIAEHPFGIGYMGYPVLRGYYQTGVYHVTYIHNEILQLLVDVGWIPTALFVAALFGSFFRKGKSGTERIMLIVIMAHSMMDFDFQFTAIWFLLLPLLEFRSGKSVALRAGKRAACGAAAAFMLLCLWTGAGDLLYSLGKVDACLAIMPIHTQALQLRLTTISDVDILGKTADQILRLCPRSSIALSAKANAAYGQGEIAAMMRYKELAISYNPYEPEEYADYFEKLYEAMQLYLAAGDTESAQVCREKLLNIPNMLKTVEERSSPLAYQIQHKPELTLPEKYQTLLGDLA